MHPVRMNTILISQIINYSLFSNALWSDITIVCGSYKFQGHKAIIFPASKYFAEASERNYTVVRLSRSLFLESDNLLNI